MMALRMRNMINMFRTRTIESGQLLSTYGRVEVPEDRDAPGERWNDEFAGSSLRSSWTKTTQFTGDHSISNGVLTLTTGATQNSYVRLISNFGKRLDKGTDQITIIGLIKPNYNTHDKCDWKFGIANKAASPTDYVWFRHATATGDNLVTVFNAKNSVSAGASGIALTDNMWHLLKAVITSTRVVYYVDDKIVETETLNVPDDEVLYPFMSIDTAEAAAQTMDVEYFRYYYL